MVPHMAGNEAWTRGDRCRLPWGGGGGLWYLDDVGNPPFVGSRAPTGLLNRGIPKASSPPRSLARVLRLLGMPPILRAHPRGLPTVELAVLLRVDSQRLMNGVPPAKRL